MSVDGDDCVKKPTRAAEIIITNDLFLFYHNFWGYNISFDQILRYKFRGFNRCF